MVAYYHQYLPSCYFMLLLLCACSVTKLCLTLCDPMDCSPLGSSVHWITQARILEWVVISFSRGSSPPRGRIHVFSLLRRFFTTESPGRPIVAVTLPYTTFPIPLILLKASLYHIGTALEKELRALQPLLSHWLQWCISSFIQIDSLIQQIFLQCLLCLKLFSKSYNQGFPGGSVMRTQCFHCHGPGFDPWPRN